MKVSTSISAKEIKKVLVSEGVKVLRCVQSKHDSILLTIGSEVSNQEMTLAVLNRIGLSKISGMFKVVNTDYDYVDYGHLYKFINPYERIK